MSFRFWRRLRLAPGITLNLSKSSASLSFGPRGAKYTVGPRGNRFTLGLPGSGLFYTVHKPWGRAKKATADRLKLGFLARLTTPANERSFVEGLRELNETRQEAALAALERAGELPDAAWLAGMLRLRQEEYAAARRHLIRALAGRSDLGSLFAKYEVEAEITLPITDTILAHVGPRERGTRLALVEIAQETGEAEEALEQLEQLLQIAPQDPVVLLSFAELALDSPEDRELMEQVISMTSGVPNEIPIDTAILYYRGRALTALGLPEAAIEVFTLANRRRKDRPPALLHQIRYERALLYEQVGRRAQARKELEKLYALNPDLEDVRQRLGLA
ncbi:MAG TPA: DUF4236 domain-containing protein [Kiloniellales bacterium]|jgi:tetratricopeptide (TPR) repeat protein|nr:DUF4236 domain-containing protein [Kiloniellales bacterium]